ncbi:hypothetical protein V5O48_003883 [Marasmius crinis-equi]|uniref:Uncharacterized protein n=1 Tax=Marasmius crinis-equi TaxID=585013 RepID=A0ABR3FRZ3_9AGAR
MVQLSQSSTIGNSDSPTAAAAGGNLNFPPPSATLVEPGPRSPSPIDRSTGFSFIGKALPFLKICVSTVLIFHAGFPTQEAGSRSVPRTYSSTTYDTERHTTSSQFTVEHVRVPGLVITTTTKVQFQHPDHFLNAAANNPVATAPANSGVAANSVNVVQTDGYPTDEESGSEDGNDATDATSAHSDDSDDSDTSFVDAYLVPSPPAYSRPADESPPFYVIFLGREVGIFQGEWDAVVRPHCLGVSHARNTRFDNWDDALYQYARAYQNWRPGWQITVLDCPSPVIRDTSYRWSERPGPGVRMLGVIDITGLDLDPSRVTKIART